MEEKQKFCRRCLLSELSQDGYFESVYEYIRSIPSEEKVAQEEYLQRLERCRNCDSLVNGMCRECGCFVEVRAARKITHCPGVHPAW